MNKMLIFAVLFTPVFLNCKKSEQKKLSLEITSSEWYTTTSTFNNNKFCNVHLKVSGTAECALLSISTFGDGVEGCREIKCDADHKFTADMEICFFPKRDSTERKFSTSLNAYSSRISPKIVICDATGSGEILTKVVESPMLNCK